MASNETSPKFRVNVIGAGVCGLSVALQIKRTWGKRVQVVITADKFMQETTSFVAGGLWEPHLLADTPPELIVRWSKYSYNYYKDLFTSKVAGKAGVSRIEVQNNFTRSQPKPIWADIPHSYSSFDAAELSDQGLPSKYVHAQRFTSYVAEPRYFLQFLTSELESYCQPSNASVTKVSDSITTDSMDNRGVVFQRKTVESIDEQLNASGNEFAAIINCSGLGAAGLVGDKNMFPVRGQVLKVQAPWFQSSYTFCDEFYLIPHTFNGTVVIGGTCQTDDWNTNESKSDTRRIIEEICGVFPSLQNAPLLDVLVGLRPCRSSVRLDSEVIAGPCRTCVNGDNGGDNSGDNDGDIDGDNSGDNGGNNDGDNGGDHFNVNKTSRNNYDSNCNKSSSGSSCSNLSMQQQLVVHCYGLGGCGYTVGPGLAHDVVACHLQPFLNQQWKL